MGLDGIELVLAMEEAFGVELKDDEVTQSATPRMIGDVIFSKLQTTDEHICQSQQAFYILRKAFLGMFDLERKSITPDMEFRDLFEKSQEKESWERIKLAVAARSWPELVRPLWMSLLLAAATFTIFGAIIYAAIQRSFGTDLGLIIGIVLAFLFAIFAVRFTRPFRICIPSRIRSVRDLIPYVITSENIAWTRVQVSARVKQIIIEQRAISEAEYTENSPIKT